MLDGVYGDDGPIEQPQDGKEDLRDKEKDKYGVIKKTSDEQKQADTKVGSNFEVMMAKFSAEFDERDTNKDGVVVVAELVQHAIQEMIDKKQQISRAKIPELR